MKREQVAPFLRGLSILPLGKIVRKIITCHVDLNLLQKKRETKKSTFFKEIVSIFLRPIHFDRYTLYT